MTETKKFKKKTVNTKEFVQTKGSNANRNLLTHAIDQKSKGKTETKNFKKMTRKTNQFFFKHYNEKLSSTLGTLCHELRHTKKDITIKTTPGDLNPVLYHLQKQSLGLYEQLNEMICIDTPEYQLRFSIIYKLYSMIYNSHIYVVTQTDEVTPIPSVSRLYSSATWLEREIWDLFGIFFPENPDLRRILTDYGFQGHPLRKDFPLTGFVEVYYNDSTKRLSYEPVELAQEFRIMHFQSPFRKRNDFPQAPKL